MSKKIKNKNIKEEQNNVHKHKLKNGKEYIIKKSKIEQFVEKSNKKADDLLIKLEVFAPRLGKIIKFIFNFFRKEKLTGKAWAKDKINRCVSTVIVIILAYYSPLICNIPYLSFYVALYILTFCFSLVNIKSSIRLFRLHYYRIISIICCILSFIFLVLSIGGLNYVINF